MAIAPDFVEPTTRISLGELIDAIEKNGYEQAHGTLFELDDETVNPKTFGQEHVTKACALGQGLLNLNIRALVTGVWGPSDFYKAEDYENARIFKRLFKRVAQLNDLDRLTPEQIAPMVRSEFSGYLDITCPAYRWDDDISTLRFSGEPRL